MQIEYPSQAAFTNEAIFWKIKKKEQNDSSILYALQKWRKNNQSTE